MKNLTIFLYGIFVILLILIYGKIRCFHPHLDFLAVHKNVYVDGWLLSHFVLFAICGYFFPNNFYFAMLLGILWEIVEHLQLLTFASSCKNNEGNKSSLIKYQFIFEDKSQNNDINKNWWYGRYEDIIVDFLGFVTGYFILNYKFV